VLSGTERAGVVRGFGRRGRETSQTLDDQRPGTVRGQRGYSEDSGTAVPRRDPDPGRRSARSDLPRSHRGVPAALEDRSVCPVRVPRRSVLRLRLQDLRHEPDAGDDGRRIPAADAADVPGAAASRGGAGNGQLQEQDGRGDQELLPVLADLRPPVRARHRQGRERSREKERQQGRKYNADDEDVSGRVEVLRRTD